MNATTFDKHPELGTNYWSEHAQYPLADWQQLVQDNSTRLGYWDWVLAQVEELGVQANTSDQGKLVNLALAEVQRAFPSVVTVSFDEDGTWEFLTATGIAPNFDNTNIDMDLIEAASNTVLDLPATFKAA